MDKKQTISEWLIENFYYIHAFMRQRESDPEVAADLAQKAFAKLSAYEAAGKRIDNLNAYAWSAVRSVLLDHYRAKRRRSFSEVPEDIPDPRKSAEYVHGLRDLLHPEIKKLPPRQREIIWFRYFEGLESWEISKKLGIRETTVRNIHSLAIRRLRQGLAEQGIIGVEGAIEH